MGLQSYSSTQMDPKGVSLAGRFIPPATHGSFLDPTSSLAATVEMQKQMASFLLTRGKAVVVEDASTMEPVAEPGAEKAAPAAAEKTAPPEKKALPLDKKELKIGKGGRHES